MLCCVVVLCCVVLCCVVLCCVVLCCVVLCCVVLCCVVLCCIVMYCTNNYGTAVIGISSGHTITKITKNHKEEALFKFFCMNERLRPQCDKGLLGSTAIFFLNLYKYLPKL